MKTKALLLLAGWKGYALVALAGAVLAGLAVYAVQELRIDNQAMRAEVAETNEANAKVDLQACRQSAERQNQAIDDLKERARLAAEAMKQAEGERDSAERMAGKILRERPPAGADKCHAAQEAFAAELARERAP